ncbi:pyruvate kinase [Mycolicibacterium sp. CH28]|uniref:PEP/pyruvate-binding domain-containing protein n=1 Tax=Mycolicibacterium sp. CH28 TaxID=2512237 RepID=UPI001080B9D1|nr:PEP/pyruvate-binding domain-containing protein [Mycolicibacterium sp. CH28]TGD84054.1 pyruvate kinase [Mycolicibacterium sp. CH28]
MSTVVDLAQASMGNAGPKMARLGELIRHGIDVPAGFVVPSTAYQRGADGLEGPLGDEIAQAYRRLCGGSDKPVVVRSSAIDEDGVKASFAGIYDSYLGVLGADRVVEAVRACWAGLHSERAVAYRERLGAGEPAVSMAVGVMLMVAARSSGVAFTVDPVTGRGDRLVIEASWGFGEPVVQGVVTPDRIEVAEDGRVLRNEAGDKRIALVYGKNGMEHVQLPAGRARTPALTNDEAARLSERVRAVAALADQPVDCEWVIDDAGTVWIVQWRAVTALPAADAPLWDPAEYAARYAFRSA